LSQRWYYLFSKNTRKIKIYKKKQLRDQFWGSSNILPINRSTQLKTGGPQRRGGPVWREKRKEKNKPWIYLFSKQPPPPLPLWFFFLLPLPQLLTNTDQPSPLSHNTNLPTPPSRTKSLSPTDHLVVSLSPLSLSPATYQNRCIFLHLLQNTEPLTSPEPAPTLPPLLFSPQILPLSSSLYPPRPSFPPAPPHLAKQNSCSNPGLEFFGLHTVAPSPSSSRETNKPNSRPLVLIFFSSRPTGSHHRPLPPTGVKTIQQHAHRAISAVHTVRQQRRHRSTVARSATQNRGEDGEAPITDLRKKKVKQIRMESRGKQI